MKGKKSVIIYGLGKGYESAKKYIESKFDVVGYSDRDEKKVVGG